MAPPSALSSKLAKMVRARAHAWVARRYQLPEIPLALERLARAGFSPSEIFDVGAYRGEFAIESLRVWPNARVTCFEVLEDKLATLRTLAGSDPRIDVRATLLGPEERENVPFHVAETASSVLAEQAASIQAPVRSVPMTSIDTLVGRNAAPPTFLKLDVQGYELAVMQGAERSLSSIEVILAETNFLDIYEGVPLVGELIAWLGERGFLPYDICGLTRRPLDGALWQADLIFVPNDSPLRADKRWGAT